MLPLAQYYDYGSQIALDGFQQVGYKLKMGDEADQIAQYAAAISPESFQSSYRR
jgi:hypothetical protein